MSAGADTAALHFQDCSTRMRCGCKGPGAEGWLGSQGFRVPAAPNSAALDADGVLVARLATSEFLLEATASTAAGVARVQATRAQLATRLQPRDVYAVVRADTVQTISGSGLAELLRQTCSVDFAPLLAPRNDAGASGQAGDGPVLLTSMIGVGVLAWPQAAAAPSLTLWCDPSFGHYFWTTLREVGGSDR
jgi:hypothetical protein